MCPHLRAPTLIVQISVLVPLTYQARTRLPAGVKVIPPRRPLAGPSPNGPVARAIAGCTPATGAAEAKLSGAPNRQTKAAVAANGRRRNIVIAHVPVSAEDSH